MAALRPASVSPQTRGLKRLPEMLDRVAQRPRIRIPADEGIETMALLTDRIAGSTPASVSPQTRGLKHEANAVTQYGQSARIRIPADEGIETRLPHRSLPLRLCPHPYPRRRGD